MNRAQFEVMAEILEISKKGASISAIISNCSLNWDFANRLITQLLETRLIEFNYSFQKTEKGLRFVMTWKSLNSLLTNKQFPII